MHRCDARRLRPLVGVLAWAAVLLLVATAIFDLVLLPPTPRLVCQRVLLALLAVKLALCEAGWGWLRRLYPHMRSAAVRGLFVVFCGSLLLDKQMRPSVITGITAMGLGVLLALVGLLVDVRG